MKVRSELHKKPTNKETNKIIEIKNSGVLIKTIIQNRNI